MIKEEKRMSGLIECENCPSISFHIHVSEENDMLIYQCVACGHVETQYFNETVSEDEQI